MLKAGLFFKDIFGLSGQRANRRRKEIKEMANTQLHLHTAHSLNDGTIEASALVARLKEMGATACAVTDHGTLMAVEEFTAAFEKAGLKLIPGVEAYVDSGKGQREHLVLLSADSVGYKAICRAVTESNSNIDAKGFTLITVEMLEKWFGEGADGHGHVIATSACIQGVVACELRHNDFLEKAAERHEAKMEKVGFDVDAYNSLLQTLKKEEEKLEAVKEQRRELASLKDKPFKKKLKDLERLLTLIGEDEYAKRKADLDAEMEASREAAKSFILVKAEEKLQSKVCTGIRESVKKLSSKAERYEQEKAKAAEIRAQKLPESVLFENAVQKAEAFKRIFGEGNFYGEIQYHGIPDEARIYPLIVQVAKKCGLPLVATNDAHIISNAEDERRRRQYLRSLRFNKWEDESVGDDQLYVKTDEELKEALIQILPEEVVDRAIQINQEVADRCNVLMEKGEHYPKYPCKEGETPESIMRELLNKGWKEKLGFKRDHPLYQLYHDRVEYELEVIKKLNVLDYHLIVQDFLEYGRLLGKIDLSDPRYLADPYNKELLRELADGRVGFGIGIGRGSAVGSLVCYLIGITGADPIKYNLLFERFLNTERVTMPEIYRATIVNPIAQGCAA